MPHGDAVIVKIFGNLITDLEAQNERPAENKAKAIREINSVSSQYQVVRVESL